MTHREVNFDGLIGPTHNYAGLSIGNLASANNQGLTSNPRAAALQGLAKMRAVMGLGIPQGFLPPLARPDLGVLRALGFTGSDRQCLDKAAQSAPDLLANIYSASCMWTANAATVAPSPDTSDGKVHFLPANLAANFHRTIEAPQTAAVLRHIFKDGSVFVHHPVLPGGVHFGDEGAANHGRFCADHGARATHLFVYGRDGKRFPARQRHTASAAVARAFGLAPDQAVFLQQSTHALDAGAFHNDVVSVVNNQVLFTHELAFEDQKEALARLRLTVPALQIVEAPADQVSLKEAISTYLFNSQLLTLETGKGVHRMALILPSESEENDRVRTFLDGVVAADNPIDQVLYKDVRESMRNGGGPACLRLRVVLSEAERAAMDPHFLLDEERIAALEAWVRAHYRDHLHPDDLRDPALMDECFAAFDALTDLLGMGSFYRFQQ
ncbi:MAG: N-succinylarginine dihydrolase [Pseudomonadota bacterium]